MELHCRRGCLIYLGETAEGMQFVANIGYDAVGTFSSLLMTSLGYSSRQARILQMSQSAVTFLAVLYIADKTKDAHFGLESLRFLKRSSVRCSKDSRAISSEL